MKKIINLILSIPQDKLLHFIAGLIVSAFFYIVLNMTVAIIPVIFIAIGKEFIDQWKDKEFNWYDALATFLGGAVIQIFIVL